MKALRIRLFGVPRLERAGEVIDISRRKMVALLAYLAVSGQPQSRDLLATMLWPDFDQSSARANLRRDLSRLKQLLGEYFLNVERNQVQLLQQPELWLDVRQFEASLARARQHHPTARQLCDDCAAALVEAVGLYHDDFLAGFTLPDSVDFDEWQFFQREGLRQALAEALQRLIDWRVAGAAYEEAIIYGRRWVSLDPLHEPAQRRLMQLYAWSGQQAAAMRQYQEAVRLLSEELGVEPEEETTVLHEAIRSRQLTAPHTRTGPESAGSEGRYELLDLLAVGGHAEVYYGRDRESGADVVIKRLKPELLVKDAIYLERFIREATALSRLDHPNIVRILGSFEEKGQHSIVMEYVPGGSLRQLLDKEGALSLDRALEIALELADALARAHHLNVIHRDLKPDNVLLASDGTPKLTDFGLARLRREDVRLTRTGTVLGSPAYMSPEALRGEELDPRSDIWSFGVLLYEMLAGRKPFEGEQLTPILVSILQDAAPPLAEFRRDAPPALAELLARLLQKEASHRPLSMRLVAAELEALAAGTSYLQPNSQHVPPAVASGSAAGSPKTDWKDSAFVGREQTLGTLRSLLQEAIAGKPAVAFITGEAGQGKTSLLKTFVRQSGAHYSDLLVAGGNCNAYTGSGDPFLPFREILEMLTGDVGARGYASDLSLAQLQQLQAAIPQTVAALVETGPDLLDSFVPSRNVLQSVAGIAEEQAPWRPQLQMLADLHATQGERHNLQQSDLFEQYARVLKALSRHKPLLLFLDDLQWVDQGSANLLLHLGRSMHGHPIMILGAYRPAEVSLGRDGSRHPLETTLFELQRVFGRIIFDLSQEEGRAFIDALLDSEPNRLDESFRETLYQQTGGHALFTVELLRGMQERGDLAKDSDGVWTVQAQLDWHTLPARVEGAIGERISRLPATLQELLEIGSVEGEEFSAETVARVLGKDERTTARLFSSELDRNHTLVRALGTRNLGGARLSRYRFRHILIQRYLYNSMDDVEKVYQHEAVGQALEALYGEEAQLIAPQLARHFELAQLPDKAAVHLQNAGDQARRTIALQEAARYYEAALARWPSADAEGRALVLRKIGECQWIMGDLQGALETYGACYKLFESVHNLQGAGSVHRSIGRLYWEIGERELSLQFYQKSLETLQKIPESVELAWTFSSISQMHMLAAQYDDAIVWGQRALTLAQRLQSEEVTTHALNNLGVAHMETGRLEEGKAMVRQSLEQALALGLPHDACRAYLNLGEVPAGAHEERRVVLEELAAYANKIRAPLYAGSAQVELAYIEWELGEWRAARARQTDIDLWLGRAPSMGYLRCIRSNLYGRMHNDLGQFDQALQHLEPTLSLARSQNEVQILGPHLGQSARALAGQGHAREAFALLQEMLDAISAQPYVHRDSVHSLFFAAAWFVEQTLDAPASEENNAGFETMTLARQCCGLLAKADAYGTKPDAAAASREASAMVMFAEGRASEAGAMLQEAARQWAALKMPLEEARALVRMAQILQSVGDLPGVNAATRRAAALYTTLLAQLDEETDRETLLSTQSIKALVALHPAAEFLLRRAGRENAAARPEEIAERQHPPHNLPALQTPFVGRQREVAELYDLLVQGTERRLVTLVGPGGIGKTRLALAVAAELLPSFAGGVYFVPLATLTSGGQLATAIAEQTGFRFAGNEAFEEQLINYLCARRALLVLDNFEHVLEGVSLVAALLDKAPQLSMLVTSREQLNLVGEMVYPLQGLSYPPVAPAGAVTPEASAYGAVQLLVQQAQWQMPGYTPDGPDLAAAARIAGLVEGMPLPLLLAASWLSLLTFAEIAAEISADIDFLASEARDLPPRQRSMRAVFEGSWERLEEHEREIVANLSVFRGLFDRAAAEAVAGANPRALRSLLQKSWIQRTGEGRFHIHELLRQYSAKKLEEDGQRHELIQRRHAAYFAEFLASEFPEMRGAAQNHAYARVAAEIGHIDQAWRWLLKERAFEVVISQMLPALFRFSETRVEAFTLSQLLEAALGSLPAVDEEGDVDVRVCIMRATLLTAAGAYFRTGYPARFEAFGMIIPAHVEAVREAWALAQRAGGLQSAYWDTLLGYIYGRIVDRDAGLQYVRALLPALTRPQAPWERAFALHALALLIMRQAPQMQQDQFSEAEAALEEALAVFEALGDIREIGHSQRSLGQLHRLKREFPKAIERWTLAQSQLEEAGEWAVAGDIYWQIGDAYLQMGQIEEAFPQYRRMSEAYLRSGNNRLAAMVLSKESYEAARFGKLEYARETREMALALAQQSGDLFAEAWSHWEMGELLRLSGERAQARRWYEQARALFEQIGEYAGITFYYRGLGDLALGEGNYKEAAQAFRRSVEQAQTSANAWAMAYALAGLGMAALKLQKVDEALQQLTRGLQLAKESGDAGVTLRQLATIAHYFQATDNDDLAMELAALVMHHPISWQETRALASAVQKAGVMPVDLPPVSEQHGKGLTLWETVEHVSHVLTRQRAVHKAALNVPAESIAFVGRIEELAEIRRLLTEGDVRLLTLLGPGGIGKTRLALAVAGTIFEDFEAVCFVTLATLDSIEQIAPAMGMGLGLQLTGNDPKQTLLDYLRQRRILLVIDNFEHLLAGALLVSEVLVTAPDVKILVTSRERLNLSAEVVRPLQGLDYPPGALDAPFAADAVSCDAIELLLQRAKMMAPHYSAGMDDLPALVRISRLVQGMPLALLLAAGWLEILSFDEIAAEIEADLDFLSSESRDTPERQKSVRAAFNTSWRRLNADMQTAFIKLCVFSGGFTRQAALAVAGAKLHTLRTLTNKSFVNARRGGRFEIHELLRQYGLEALAESTETEKTRDHHSHYYLQAVNEQTPRLKGREQLQAVEKIDIDFDNVRSAWNWAVRRGRRSDVLDALEALTVFFGAYRRNPDEFVTLMRQACERLLDRSALDLPGSRLLTSLAQTLSYAARPDANSWDDLQLSLAVAREHGSMVDEGLAFYGMGHYALRVESSLENALGFYQHAFERFEGAGETYYAAIALGQIAYCQKGLGRMQEAINGYLAALERRRSMDDSINTAVTLAHLGETNFCMGHYDVAEQYDREALREAGTVGSWFPLPAVDARLALRRFLSGEIDAGAIDAEDAYRTALETSAQVTGIGRPYALAVMSVSKSVHGDYPGALELAEQAVAIAGNLTVLGQILAQWSLSMALLGVGNITAAEEIARRTEKQARETGHTGPLDWLLPVLAVLKARQDQYEAATVLLAQAYHVPAEVRGWLAHWPVIQQLRDDLLSKLGKDVFQAAWKRGQKSDRLEV